MERFKYPKTLHFSWSPNLQNDDRMLPSDDIFVGKRVVGTEKLDGENTSLYNDGTHARSLDSSYHRSRSYMFKLQGEIGYLLKDGEKICGENIAAEHSIHYNNMETFFYVFNIWQGETCLSWDDTVKRCEELGLVTVPVLYMGEWDKDIIRSLDTTNRGDNETEGYVVRLADSFHLDNFQTSTGKYVRKNHVRTDQLWMNKPVIWNEWK